jgi:hypothetical protein
MTRYILLVILFCSFGFSQTPKDIAPIDTESPSHKRIRIEYDKTNGIYLMQKAELDALVKESHDFSARASAIKVDNEKPFDEATRKALEEGLMLRRKALAANRKAQAFNEELGPIRELVDRLSAQLKNVDDCAKLYPATIDKKVSDLTTRETDAIKMCKALDLYPPPKDEEKSRP